MKIIKIYFLFLITWLYAHDKIVHQYIVKEAWKLIEYQMPEMETSTMKGWIGNDETEYCTNIVSGAYNEDNQDIIYMNCGWNFLTGCVETTLNHFWSADAGEYSKFNWDGSHDNAKVKAEYMFYGNHIWYFGLSNEYPSCEVPVYFVDLSSYF